MSESNSDTDPHFRRRLLLRTFAVCGFLAASRPALATPLGASLLQWDDSQDADPQGEPCTHSNTKSKSATHPIWTRTHTFKYGTDDSVTRTGTWTASSTQEKTYTYSHSYTFAQLWGTATLSAVAATRLVSHSHNSEFTYRFTLSRTATAGMATATYSVETTATGGLSETFAQYWTYTSTIPCDDENETPVELAVVPRGGDPAPSRRLGAIDAVDDLRDPERRHGAHLRLNL